MRSRVRRGFKTGMLEIGNVFGAEQSDSLTFKIPSTRVALNRNILREVQQMKEVAAKNHMLYLTANQVQSLNRAFVINKLHSLVALTHPDYCNSTDYQAYINPIIKTKRGEVSEIEEQCLAIPFITFIVPRYEQIQLEYRDESRDYFTEKMQGKIAHLAQHCINHLDGQLLLDYQLSQGRFYVQKDVAVHFPKTNFLLKEYSLRLKTHHSKVTKGQASLEDEKFIQIKKDYVDRLKEQYDKESRSFSQKVEKRQKKT